MQTISINLIVPERRTDLSDKLLRYVFQLIVDEFNLDEIKVLCFLQWSIETRPWSFCYDATAIGSNYAVNEQDFRWVVVHELLILDFQTAGVSLGNNGFRKD